MLTHMHIYVYIYINIDINQYTSLIREGEGYPESMEVFVHATSETNGKKTTRYHVHINTSYRHSASCTGDTSTLCQTNKDLQHLKSHNEKVLT